MAELEITSDQLGTIDTNQIAQISLKDGTLIMVNTGAEQEQQVEQVEQAPVEEEFVQEEQVQEEQVQEEPQKIVPEIIAAVESEPAIQEQPTIVPVMQAQVKQSTAAPKKPKTQRTRKKRRRYDADIAGGFDF